MKEKKITVTFLLPLITDFKEPYQLNGKVHYVSQQASTVSLKSAKHP